MPQYYNLYSSLFWFYFNVSLDSCTFPFPSPLYSKEYLVLFFINDCNIFLFRVFKTPDRMDLLVEKVKIQVVATTVVFHSQFIRILT